MRPVSLFVDTTLLWRKCTKTAQRRRVDTNTRGLLATDAAKLSGKQMRDRPRSRAVRRSPKRWRAARVRPVTSFFIFEGYCESVRTTETPPFRPPSQQAPSSTKHSHRRGMIAVWWGTGMKESFRVSSVNAAKNEYANICLQYAHKIFDVLVHIQ